MLTSLPLSPSRFARRIIAVVFLSSSLLPKHVSVTCQNINVGDEVCAEGYIMDYYCIERGRLLENDRIETLRNPEQHSVHCLIDFRVCYESPFEILFDPEEDGGDELFARAYRLDDSGRQMAIDLAAKTGLKNGNPSCARCTGEGTLQSGFRATINGTVVNLGDENAPALLRVTSVLDSSVGCGNFTARPTNLLTTSGSLQTKIYAHGSLMLIGWGLLLPSGAIFARFFKHRPNSLWFKIHRALQLFGLTVALTGWIIALKNFDVFSLKGHNYYRHGVLGTTTMALGILQPLNAFIRPHPAPEGGVDKKTKLRAIWEIIHKCFGYTALLLAVVTIAYGTTLVPKEEDQVAFQIAYGVGVGGLLLLLLVVLFLDKKKYVKIIEEDDTYFDGKKSGENEESIGLSA